MRSMIRQQPFALLRHVVSTDQRRRIMLMSSRRESALAQRALAITFPNTYHYHTRSNQQRCLYSTSTFHQLSSLSNEETTAKTPSYYTEDQRFVMEECRKLHGSIMPINEKVSEEK